MSNYRWSICEPDHPEVIEKGLILKDDILKTFEHFPWIDYLRKMTLMKEDEICFSPSFEIQDTDTNQSISFSIVGDEANHEFYIFYKRPKAIKTFFGLSKKEVKEHTSNITGQAKEDVTKFLTAFLNNDAGYMEAKME